MPAREFDLIKRYFADWRVHDKGVLLGVGDDCALIIPPTGEVLAVSVDTMVSGVHFFPDTLAAVIGYRALAVSVSDLAAMGAEPLSFTLSLTLPDADEAWLSEFSRGLRIAADEYAISLVGGDTTRGPLTIGVQVLGCVPQALALKRQGAKVGDLVCVTGTLGDAGAGLALVQEGGDASAFTLDVLLASAETVISRFFCPTPRLAYGRLLRSYASACIDVSDGLVADLSHVVEVSSVGAVVNICQLPLSKSIQENPGRDCVEFALSSGDDYELCFTIAKDRWHALQNDAQYRHLTKTVPVTVIGHVVADSGVTVQGSQGGGARSAANSGYHHF